MVTKGVDNTNVNATTKVSSVDLTDYCSDKMVESANGDYDAVIHDVDLEYEYSEFRIDPCDVFNSRELIGLVWEEDMVSSENLNGESIDVDSFPSPS